MVYWRAVLCRSTVVILESGAAALVRNTLRYIEQNNETEPKIRKNNKRDKRIQSKMKDLTELPMGERQLAL